MIQTLSIQNFKSIANVALNLGNINVLIGANGSGKSNILEAVGMAAAERDGYIKTDELFYKGVRIAKPNLVVGSFFGHKPSQKIAITVSNENEQLNYLITNEHPDDIYADWHASVNTSESVELKNTLSKYLIYSASIDALRGFTTGSYQMPLGLNGEGLDVLLSTMSETDKRLIKDEVTECIPWMQDIFIDTNDTYKMQGYKLGRSKSNLYFQDRYMQKTNNIFSAENANEGILELLFYLTLFVSMKTPSFFAIDNIDNGLNPRLCRHLLTILAKLAKNNGKQVLLTTQNPAVLDGLNLNDNNQKLYVVERNDEGYTIAKQLRTKESSSKMKLSEMWMNGLIGGVPNNF